MILVVKEPFEDYKKGQPITDPDTVAAILASDNSGHVLKVAGGEE